MAVGCQSSRTHEDLEMAWQWPAEETAPAGQDLGIVAVGFVESSGVGKAVDEAAAASCRSFEVCVLVKGVPHRRIGAPV